METLLKIRAYKKKHMPAFITQDSWRRKRVSRSSWRKPRGLHSKIRLKLKGNPRMPSPGYRSPRLVRGLTSSGLKTTVVNSMRELETIKDQAVIIGSNIGIKKKLVMLKIATEKKLTILNVNAADFIKTVETKLETRKNEKTKIAKEKAAKETKKSEKESKEVPMTEEEKQKASKKDAEKIITKRN